MKEALTPTGQIPPETLIIAEHRIGRVTKVTAFRRRLVRDRRCHGNLLTLLVDAWVFGDFLRPSRFLLKKKSDRENVPSSRSLLSQTRHLPDL
jgi:hypothetical protein